MLCLALLPLTRPESKAKKDTCFSIIKHGLYYFIRHNDTGHERFAGDGTNVIYEAATNRPVPPDAEDFIKLWEDDLNAHADEIWEDFFAS